MSKKAGNGSPEGYWVVRTYSAGRIGEKIKYWVPGEKPTRSKRKMKSDINKQRQNEFSAVKRVARLLNANFTAGADALFTVTYNPQALEAIELHAMETLAGDVSAEDFRNACYDLAHHQLVNFIRRVRRACTAAGIPLRYLAVTSDMNGKTEEAVRLHHHLVVNREALDICREKWTAGEAEGKVLDNLSFVDQDLTPLAEYLLDQVRRLPDERKYVPSRSLVIPQPKDRAVSTGAELRVPRGGQLLHRNEWKPGMPMYIRYVLPLDKINTGKTPPAKLDSTRARGGAHTRTRSSNPG